MTIDNVPKKIMNLQINFMLLVMIPMMESKNEITEKMADILSTTFTEKHTDQKNRKEIEKKFSELVHKMVADIKKQINEKSDQIMNIIEKISKDPDVWEGLTIVDHYNFDLPKLYEELSEKEIESYLILLYKNDEHARELMRELSIWIKRISDKYPELHKKV